jgi:hypothetical protein
MTVGRKPNAVAKVVNYYGGGSTEPGGVTLGPGNSHARPPPHFAVATDAPSPSPSCPPPPGVPAAPGNPRRPLPDRRPPPHPAPAVQRLGSPGRRLRPAVRGRPARGPPDRRGLRSGCRRPALPSVGRPSRPARHLSHDARHGPPTLEAGNSGSGRGHRRPVRRSGPRPVAGRPGDDRRPVGRFTSTGRRHRSTRTVAPGDRRGGRGREDPGCQRPGPGAGVDGPGPPTRSPPRPVADGDSHRSRRRGRGVPRGCAPAGTPRRIRGRVRRGTPRRRRRAGARLARRRLPPATVHSGRRGHHRRPRDRVRPTPPGQSHRRGRDEP